jgi:anti-sigma-K factor RsiG
MPGDGPKVSGGDALDKAVVTAMAVRKGGQPGSRRRTITAPEPSPHLADLSLQQLRGYRERLNLEEEKASYWRRLIHARIDVLEAEAHTDGALSIEDLVRVLGETGSGQTRKALLRVRPADPLPDLPVLSDMWVEDVDPHDDAALGEALDRLHGAEKQLTEYRHALHERIDEATSELIVRYRENPASALSALPEVRR